jgi:hypothetical protein
LPTGPRQCQLQLASFIVHEAWHYRHGFEEAAAYQEQLNFLIFNEALDSIVASVRRARKHAVTAAKNRSPREGSTVTIVDANEGLGVDSKVGQD